ncbi:MAG: DMT family transporter [Pseudomonadota bacterium]
MFAADADRRDTARLAIGCILAGVVLISVNDMLIKALSGDYPLHQIVFIRSIIGITITLTILQWEGGLAKLYTATPFLHLLRGLLIVAANMLYYAAIVVMPLADATAIFYVAPLLITLLSVPFLGEQVGPRRLGACAVGFLGVVVMMRPWESGAADGVNRWLLLLPVGSALAYASMQILTRRLGVSAPASAMAAYIQGSFIGVSLLFFLIAGDGRLAEGLKSPSLIFLLRAWIVPPTEDLWLFLLLGLTAGGIGYCLSQAYRSAEAAVVAPFEYVLLPLAIFWGWSVFGEVPGPTVVIGIALIAGAGVYVFVREGVRGRQVATGRPTRRP